MEVVSYAQNFEDILLHRVFSDVENGFYVDIGAWHPMRDSVTHLFYSRGWSGINIEPGDVFDVLAAARPRDINLKMAVHDHAGDMLFEQFPDAASCLSFLHEAGSSDSQAATSGSIKSVVPIDTLTHILSKHGQGRAIDFLKIDAEGSELAIIRSTDWRNIRPTVLVIEATKPSTTEMANRQWEPILLSSGYLLAYFDGLNCFYVPDERADLLRHFKTPVGIFDRFQPYLLFDCRDTLHASIGERERLTGELLACRDSLQSANKERSRLADDVLACRDTLRTSLREREWLDEALRACRDDLQSSIRQRAQLGEELQACEEALQAAHAERERLEADLAHMTQQRDQLFAERETLVTTLHWPNGPRAVKAVLPLARLARLFL